MRLLNVVSRELHTFYDDDIPPYAALSHTWDQHEPEVSFADMERKDHQERTAYRKIDMTCRLAQAEKLLWVWIDTCCIDKSSSAELSEAINSMFQWYQHAQVCYVHLEDLPAKDATPAHDFDTTFQACRWFRRGWTLQELLAPKALVFYDSTWTSVGDRHSLADLVWRRTNIPVEYLINDRQDFHKARVGQRMSWASDRKTTRKEDMAYCLLGIFDINMPLLYGEGTRAFRRLQHEIIKTSPDDSIFAWSTAHHVPNMGGLGGVWPEDEDVPRVPLAPSPHAFRCLRHSAMPYFWRPEKTWEASSDGVRIQLPICSPAMPPNRHYSRRRDRCKVGLLNCALGGNTNKHLAIVFRRRGRGNDWERITLCTVNWEHLAAARRDTLDVREPGTDAIEEVNSGENWLRLDGLLVNIVAEGDRIVSKHVRDYFSTWIRMGLRIRTGGLTAFAPGSDYFVILERRTIFWALWFVETPFCQPVAAYIVEPRDDIPLKSLVEAPLLTKLHFMPDGSHGRRAVHRDLRLLGAFTHVVEIDGQGKSNGIGLATERPGVPSLLLVSESSAEELYLTLFAAFIGLALVVQHAIDDRSRTPPLAAMIPPSILIAGSHWRMLRLVLVDHDTAAVRHRQELSRWILAQRAELSKTLFLWLSLLLGIYLTVYYFIGESSSWLRHYVEILVTGPSILLWGKLLGAVISIHHPELGARGRMIGRVWIVQPLSFIGSWISRRVSETIGVVQRTSWKQQAARWPFVVFTFEGLFLWTATACTWIWTWWFASSSPVLTGLAWNVAISGAILTLICLLRLVPPQVIDGKPAVLPAEGNREHIPRSPPKKRRKNNKTW